MYIPTKGNIGEALGISVGSSAAAIEESGDAENLIAEIVSKVNELVK